MAIRKSKTKAAKKAANDKCILFTVEIKVRLKNFADGITGGGSLSEAMEMLSDIGEANIIDAKVVSG